MGKASRRKWAARKFREEMGMTKPEWRKLKEEEKADRFYGDVPVIREKIKVNSKYPKQKA